MTFDYKGITEEILSPLKPRTKEVIEKRFGLDRDEETLQSIGNEYGITRERVRQIERAGLKSAKPQLEQFADVLDFFSNQLRIAGGARREELYLSILGPRTERNHILMLLHLDDRFQKVRGNEKLHTFWTEDHSVSDLAHKIVDSVLERLDKKGKPLHESYLEEKLEFEPHVLFGLLSISKKVRKGPQGLWGLSNWTEVNPRSTRDRAYIVLKETEKPLHFKKIAEMINNNELFGPISICPQTVHNELIKGEDFILVGRGTYGLQEWGYKAGTVKDVIADILSKKGPLSQGEIVDEVMNRRMVKRNTILFNLRNEDIFIQDKEGLYVLSDS